MGLLYIRKEASQSFVIARGAWAQTGLAIRHMHLLVCISLQENRVIRSGPLLLPGQAGACSRHPVSGSWPSCPCLGYFFSALGPWRSHCLRLAMHRDPAEGQYRGTVGLMEVGRCLQGPKCKGCFWIAFDGRQHPSRRTWSSARAHHPGRWTFLYPPWNQ